MSAEEVAKAIGVEQTVENILKNIGLILPDGTLTVAAVVLMGEYPQRWLPVFTARCISFIGNSIGGSEFRDKSGSEADGNAVHLYKYIMTFLMRNLRRKQVEADFNSPGELEVSSATLAEVVVNCILHRSYAADSPIRIFIFDNRIELHSPGLLPPGITVEDATHGVSSPRNKLLFSNGIHLLPYTGAGSGLTRAQLYTPDIKFENDERLREFVVTIWRECVRVSVIDDVRVGEVKKLNNSEISNDTSVLDLSSDTVNSVRAERIPYKLLGGVMKNIIQFCSIPRTGREILEHIGYSYHTKNLAKFITPLLDMNYLEPTIPDKPKSPHQRYRKKQK
jgi:predicted HTH transcriptional regulator